VTRSRLRILATLWLALGLFGCATLGGGGEQAEDAADRQAYEAALALRGQDRAAAAKALEAFLRDRPESPRLVRAGLALARLRLDEGDQSGAVRTLHAVLLDQPQGDGSDEARLVLARLERERGRTSVAWRVASAIRPEELEPAQRSQALRLLVDLAAARHDPVSQMRWLAALRADAADADAVALVDVEIDALAVGLAPDELSAAAAAVGPRIPAARLELDAAERALGNGNLAFARAAFGRAAALPLAPQDAAHLARVEARLREVDPEFVPPAPGGTPPPAGALAATTPTGPLDTLGVVLPLTGPFARFGQRSLEGVLLAAGIFEDDPAGGPGFRIELRDAGGKAAQAEQAVRELAADPSVGAVVGPLLAEPSEAAARAADELGIPLLALTPREDVTAGRSHVIRLGATPRAEAEALATYATESLGARRFGILAPDDAYGRGLGELFRAAVQAHGGQVVASASYPAGAPDVTPMLRTIAAAATPPPDGASPGGERGLDALFVPESRSRIAAIAPQIAASTLSGVTILGPQGWFGPELLRVAGRSLEGAVCAEPYDPESTEPTSADFTARFRAEFPDPPDVIAAQAYDAARLALGALSQGAASRDDVLRALHAVRDWPGASGEITVREDGNADKEPTLLSVRDGRFVPLPRAE
jgi:ABC-type branched-subunit amino acid transport system substrate-binding protein